MKKLNNKQLAALFLETVEGASDVQLQKAASTFVAWLRERGETRRLREVVHAIEQIWKEKYGVATMEIQTAHPLSKKAKDQLERIADGAEIREKIDPSLIAGARVRLDERIIDGSVKGALNQLKMTLLK